MNLNDASERQGKQVNDMHETTDARDDLIMQRWYQYAADTPDSVGYLLGILRQRLGQSLEEQQAEFEASEPDFTRLLGLRAPRPNVYANDAQRMAIACNLGNPRAFVRALLLSRNLVPAIPVTPSSSSSTTLSGNITPLDARRSEQLKQVSPQESVDRDYYMAAFDAQDDLDTLPHEEQEERDAEEK